MILSIKNLIDYLPIKTLTILTRYQTEVTLITPSNQELLRDTSPPRIIPHKPNTPTQRVLI